MNDKPPIDDEELRQILADFKTAMGAAVEAYFAACESVLRDLQAAFVHDQERNEGETT